MINSNEKIYLRELAKKQKEYATLPIMEEKTKKWYAHNELKGVSPIVLLEHGPFLNELGALEKCETPLGKYIERRLYSNILSHEMICDDRVVENFMPIPPVINMKELNIEKHISHAKDAKGRNIGYSMEHIIKDLEKDFHKIEKSVYSFNKEQTNENINIANDILGDILDVEYQNNSIDWFFSMTARVINIMGTETYMYSLYDYPEKIHELMDFIAKDSLEYVDWQEANDLLTLNNKNNYAGSGSYGFTNELPKKDHTNKVRKKDLWVNMNSQESVGISPSIFKEFTYPYFERVAKEFGLVYYGCCEPVHEFWDDCLSNLPNLRKVSISPWCDERFMGEKLSNSNIIYARKPSPNYLGVGSFDEAAFRDYIKQTLIHAKDCEVEFSFRDIYTLTDDNLKAKKAVGIVREIIEKHW